MDKTIVAATKDSVRHSLYGKAVKRTKSSRFTTNNECGLHRDE